MHFIVKNTTNINILDLFCPFSCKKCGKLGSPLCLCCKKHIIKQGTQKHNLKDYLEQDWQDLNGRLPFKQSFACGWRDQALGELVENYKYHSSRAIGPILGEILDGILPDLGSDVIIVPLPTAAQHIRARGFDHTLKIARNLARRRGWQCQKILARAKNTVQVGASAEERQMQAEEAYQFKKPHRHKGCQHQIANHSINFCDGTTTHKTSFRNKNISEQNDKNSPTLKYLLLDDVWTTGASLCAAAKILQEAGIKQNQIYAAVLAISR